MTFLFGFVLCKQKIDCEKIKMFIKPPPRRTDSQGIRSKTSGFSLVELITVVSIIGILAGISISTYQYSVGKAKIAVAQATLDSVRQTLVRHITEHNSPYPTTIDFTTGLDDQGQTIFPQLLLAQINKDLFSPSIIYSGNSSDFILTAQANDKNHTELILTHNSLTIQGY